MKTRLPGIGRSALGLLGLVLLLLSGTMGTSVGWWLGIPIAVGGAAALTLALWPSERGPLPPVGGEQSDDVLRAVSKRWGGL